MSASKIPQVVLKSSSNQIKMPIIAFGTAAVTNNDGEITKAAVIEAIKSGYRHFDTALIYGSEEALGEAIEEALQLGLIQSRDELFITSKLWLTDNFPHLVLSGLQKSLQNLKLEYLDLYLIHWPISVKPGNWEIPYAEDLITTFDLKGVWTAMEECQKLGLTKSIGVSNFTRKKLDDLLSFAIIPPSVNQEPEIRIFGRLDLYLIHWPMSVKPGNWEISYARKFGPLPEHVKELITTFDLKGVWTAMEKCQKLGLTKSIGVSNFTRKKLDDLLSFAKIPPSVNQVEMNPVWHQKKLKEYCEAKGIIITAFSPLGAKGTLWGSNEVMDSEILKEIAEQHGKTIAQVCLRWLLEQGVTMAVKSYNKERMNQNLEIFDWSLTKDDHEEIDKIKQIRVNNGPVVFIPNFWDGET